MNLRTTYLGLELRSPLVPSASPLSLNLDNIKRMEDAGAGAIVLHSLFEEQLRAEECESRYSMAATADGDSAPSYMPDPEAFGIGSDDYLQQITAAVKSEVKIPVAVKRSPFFTNIPGMARRWRCFVPC